jgi:hypothetical protein
MTYQIVRLRITGIGGRSGLLMHNPAGSMQQVDTGKASRSGKKIPKAYDEARAGLYVDTEVSTAPPADEPPKQLFIPSDALREASIISSKTFRDTSRRGNATWEQRFSASLFLSVDRFPLEDAGGKALTSADDCWSVYTKRAVVQGNGIMRSRALVRDWVCDAEFEYDDETIDPPMIALIVKQAGKFPGLLDYRPGKKGPFGRFRLEAVNGERFDG